MAVVRATYFMDCLRRGEPFQDRAKIPAEYLIDGKEVVNLWVKYGYAFLVVVSYSWLSKDHPDPSCFHLPRLVRALAVFREYHMRRSWRGEDRDRDRVLELEGGVILDYCSFWQGTRSEEQDRLFKEGLKLINVPYGHRDVTALKLISTPEGEVRKYDDRGWTHFESTVIDGKPPSRRHEYGELNVLTCNDDFAPQGDTGSRVFAELCRAQRKPPLTSERFRAELQRRRERAEEKGVRLFTSNKDSPVILDRYDASFAALCRSARLDYSLMRWGAEEARELALALPEFSLLRELVLQGTFRVRANEAGEAVTALAAALPHCTSLYTLNLRYNHFGDQAAAAITEALPRCASLQELGVGGNDLGEDAEAALSSAWVAAGKNEIWLEMDDDSP